jgi:dihydrofolate reductase
MFSLGLLVLQLLGAASAPETGPGSCFPDAAGLGAFEYIWYCNHPRMALNGFWRDAASGTTKSWTSGLPKAVDTARFANCACAFSTSLQSALPQTRSIEEGEHKDVGVVAILVRHDAFSEAERYHSRRDGIDSRRGAYRWKARSEDANQMRATVFVGTSLDGFIARPNGELDFLPAGGGEPHGYEEFIATVDTIVIGRKTFETVLTFPAWPYGDKRVVVLSSRPVDLSPATARGGIVEQMAGPPAEIVSRLAASGSRHLYVDGGVTIQGFLRARAVQRLVITRVPVLIGEGIPLFGIVPRDIPLRHLATRSYPSGLVQSEYELDAEDPDGERR